MNIPIKLTLTQMHFTTRLLEFLEEIEHAGKFLFYWFVFFLGISISVLLILFWAFKSRLL
jgi:hypothetical protein